MLRMPIMSSIWEASSPHLSALEETPTIWSKGSDMERSHFTLMRRRRGGLGWKGVRRWRRKGSWGGRNLESGAEGVTEECEEGLGEVYLHLQIWGMQTVEGKKGEDFIRAGNFWQWWHSGSMKTGVAGTAGRDKEDDRRGEGYQE